MTPNIPYVVSEVLVAVCAVIGNALVILVFYRERRLRRRTNYYIISLAIADLLVGLLGIPFAILASLGLPRNLHACLFTVSLLVVLCTISIFCLVAVSVDRYWAILHPMGYSRNVSTKTAIGECIQSSLCKEERETLLSLTACRTKFLPLSKLGLVRCFSQKPTTERFFNHFHVVTLYCCTVILGNF
jgi:hypothetical protein